MSHIHWYWAWQQLQPNPIETTSVCKHFYIEICQVVIWPVVVILCGGNNKVGFMPLSFLVASEHGEQLYPGLVQG